tara:strand:- start:41864 stop:42355 length:492 start_codon:yes stop_codon:yes gene_type:complete
MSELTHQDFRLKAIVKTANGRLNPTRYIVYSLIITLFFGMIAGVILAIGCALHSVLGTIIIILGVVAILAAAYYSTILTIRRCHDFNSSGWLTLLLIIPFAYFVLAAIPGTKNANDFGDECPPSTNGIKIAAYILYALQLLCALSSIPKYAVLISMLLVGGQQ